MKRIAIGAFIVMAIGLFLDAFLVIFTPASPHLGRGEIVVASVAGTLGRRKANRR